MKILVADDSKTNLVLIGESIRKLGHTCLSASSGEEALLLYQREHPDLVILDVLMEGMNGFECARKIRALDESDWIPIIFLSGVVDDENISRGINAGGDDYITKPYSEITLAAKIRAMQRISDMRKKLFETTRQLKILSVTDPLTGTFNRMQFDTILLEKIKKNSERKKILALLFLDLDNFKFVNDHLGHQAGDQLLSEAAGRLRRIISQEDAIFRLGGDEFAIILDSIDTPAAAEKVATDIITALGKPFNLNGTAVHSSCSIGIAFWPDQDTNHVTLVKNADTAMYHAKKMGRNNYKIFTEALQKERLKQIGEMDT